METSFYLKTCITLLTRHLRDGSRHSICR